MYNVLSDHVLIKPDSNTPLQKLQSTQMIVLYEKKYLVNNHMFPYFSKVNKASLVLLEFPQ